ncbi:MAG: DUF2778 domain-containing protein, partial [Proteobacteria bacterium]|nr:DUF2778 domain-containing protein [Pseudomonadota bacterium]MBU1596603.1 DUF2778 domain-containing protein [Pseudomonadota bacterium]
YSHKSGNLTGPDGAHLGTGYAGQKEGKNNTNAEGIKGVGPIPQGNWRMEEVKTNKWPEPSYKLTPDDETRKRVEALGRDPDSFYIHAQARDEARRGRGDSEGCIALGKNDRVALGKFEGRWLRVER